MFDNKLKVTTVVGRSKSKSRQKKEDRKLLARVMISGVSIAASEEIGPNPQKTYANVMESILSAVEFFPLSEVVGKETFTRAVELFATIQKGSLSQKKKAKETVNQIIYNARMKHDSTAKDIEYALSRLMRQYKDKQFNMRGELVVDALGWSPVNLRNNLDRMAQRSIPMAKAKQLYGDIISGNPSRKRSAQQKIRTIKQRAEQGDTVVGRAVLLGLSQYMKAHNQSALRKELFGNENVTVGFSFKGIKKGLKKAVTTKNLLKAGAILATGGLATPLVSTKMRRGLKKAATTKNLLKAGAILATGGLATPLVSDKMRRGLIKVAKKTGSGIKVVAKKTGKGIKVAVKTTGKVVSPALVALTASAKQGDPAAIQAIRDTNERAQDGNEQAASAMADIQTADSALSQLPPEQMEDLQVQTENADEDSSQPATEDSSQSATEDSSQPATEETQSFTEDSSLPSEETSLVQMSEEGYIVGFGFGDIMKSVGGLVKPLAKMAMPLAVRAANTFAPGSGALLANALPSMINSIPGKERPELAQIARATGIIKAADEADPSAIQKIAQIKKLAAQNVPAAKTALNALHVAKTTQQVAQSIATAKSQTAQEIAQKSAATLAPTGLVPSPSGEPIPVRIVQWGK